MCQEDAENKTGKECSRNMVDEAIKTLDICIIDRIEKENLRYAQKYTELQISEKELRVSFISIDMGLIGVMLAILAIGASFILFGVSGNTMLEQRYLNSGIVIFIMGVIMGGFLWFIGMPFMRKEEKDIKFMHKIILKIEEKL